jgi:hypothetical protein
MHFYFLHSSCVQLTTFKTGKPFFEFTNLTGWVTVSRSTPVGSKCRRALIAATYAVNTSGVLTPGCSNRVSRARCNFCVRYTLKSVFCRHIRKSSTAGCESGYSNKNKKKKVSNKSQIHSILCYNNLLACFLIYPTNSTLHSWQLYFIPCCLYAVTY